MKPPQILPISDADWPAIDQIQIESFSVTAIESVPVLRSIVDRSPSTCFLARTDRPVGYVLAHPWRSNELPPLKAELGPLPENPEALFIHDLAVSPNARGSRIGRHLVKRVLAEARSAGLNHGSLLAVQHSQTFWEQFGFEPDPVLTAQFAPIVEQKYVIDFVFMTADFVAH